MNAVSMNSSQPMGGLPQRGHFGRALLVGAVLEALLIGGLLWAGSQTPPKPVLPEKTVIAVHMVQPVPPKPKPVPPPPKPVVHPKPIPKPVMHRPLPKPVPHPIPKPVPKPLLAKTPAPTAPRFTPPPEIPAPPPPPPAPSPAAKEAAMNAYAALIRAKVQANLRVPGEIRLMRLSGKTLVAFELQPDGTLLWAKVARSSGIGAIDRVALRTVKETGYPPFTKDMPKHATTFDIEVHISGRGAS